MTSNKFPLPPDCPSSLIPGNTLHVGRIMSDRWCRKFQFYSDLSARHTPPQRVFSSRGGHPEGKLLTQKVQLFKMKRVGKLKKAVLLRILDNLEK